jgi:hypothetical protein
VPRACRCDADHSAPNSFFAFLWLAPSSSPAAVHLQELGAAELAASFFLRLQSLKGGEEVLTIHHYPTKLQNVMAVTEVLALFWQPPHNQKGALP